MACGVRCEHVKCHRMFHGNIQSVYTLKDISASQERLCHLLSKNYKSACAICWENIILHSHPEIEISFKFIPKILMTKEGIHFFWGPLCKTRLGKITWKRTSYIIRFKECNQSDHISEKGRGKVCNKQAGEEKLIKKFREKILMKLIARRAYVSSGLWRLVQV